MENVVLRSFRKFNLIYVIIVLNILSLINYLYFAYSYKVYRKLSIVEVLIYLIILVVYILLAIGKDEKKVRFLISILFISSVYSIVDTSSSLVKFIKDYLSTDYIYFSFKAHFSANKMYLFSIFVKILNSFFLFSILIGLISRNKEKFKTLITCAILINLIGSSLYTLYFTFKYSLVILQLINSSSHGYDFNNVVYQIPNRILYILMLIIWSVLMVVFYCEYKKQSRNNYKNIDEI